MPVIYIKTEEEFDKLKESNKLLLVKFGASWCGPCKQIKPNLDKLSENDNLIVIDIDVNEAQESEWSWASEVENLPTFRFIKDGNLLDEYCGSKIEKIQELVNKLS